MHTNRVLRHLTEGAHAAVKADLKPVNWSLHEVLREPGDEVNQVYFPEDAVVSLVSPIVDGRMPELATIGREGAVGCAAALASRSAFSRWLVQVPGNALALPVETFSRAFDENSEFRQTILYYSEALLSQAMQTAACNAVHPVEARCCRWILTMRDRSDSDELPLTQEFLSDIISVHRSSISIAIGALQQAGFIRSRRGKIQILDRAGLENTTCDCYQVVRDRYEELLPGTFTD